MASRSAAKQKEDTSNEAVIELYFAAITEAQKKYRVYDKKDLCRVESLVTSTLWVAMEEMLDKKLLAVDDAAALVEKYHKSYKKRTDITFMQKQMLFFKENLLPLAPWRAASSGAKQFHKKYIWTVFEKRFPPAETIVVVGVLSCFIKYFFGCCKVRLY
jgi:hypothetical protein